MLTNTIERILIECRKTKTIFIILANPAADVNSTMNYSEFDDWLWFGFPLIENMARNLPTNHGAQ